MKKIDLGCRDYLSAWAEQERAHADVIAGGEEHFILVEHPPVITFGRRAAIEGRKNLIASEAELRSRGIDLVDSDRGGDVTYHGPGQLVAYPIVRLIDHRLSVGAYVRMLEQIVITTLATFAIKAQKDECAIGVWVRDSGDLAKIAALGVRIRRGVSLHGIALNVETNLDDFKLIVPCGLTGRPVTSIRKVLNGGPSMDEVKKELTAQMLKAFESSF